MVIGAPRLEARNTSSLSGMTPSRGIRKISTTSSTLSISPREARSGSNRAIRRCFIIRSPSSAFQGLGIDEADHAIGVADRGDLRIGDDDGFVGKAHGERGTTFDARGAVADYPVECHAQLGDRAGDAIFGERILVTRLRGR